MSAFFNYQSVVNSVQQVGVRISDYQSVVNSVQ